MDVASSKFRAGVRVALGICGICAVQAAAESAGGGARRASGRVTACRPLHHPAQQWASALVSPRSVAKDKPRCGVGIGGCGNCSGIGVCVVSLTLAVLCPRLWVSWKHFAISCIFFFFLTSQIGKLTASYGAVANKTWVLSSRNSMLCRRGRAG